MDILWNIQHGKISFSSYGKQIGKKPQMKGIWAYFIINTTVNGQIDSSRICFGKVLKYMSRKKYHSKPLDLEVCILVTYWAQLKRITGGKAHRKQFENLLSRHPKLKHYHFPFPVCSALKSNRWHCLPKWMLNSKATLYCKEKGDYSQPKIPVTED